MKQPANPEPSRTSTSERNPAPDPEPFAAVLESYWQTGRGVYRYTRPDGWTRTEDAWWYFTSFPDFPRIEKRALKHVQGRVLDLGCGAGRHALYLGRKGLRVVGLESSARVAAIARARGVRDVRVGSACGALQFAEREFDTILLFGNNLGLCGNRRGTLRLMRELNRVTRRDACVLCTTRAPDLRTAQDLAYWQDRVTTGHEMGELELLIEFRGAKARVNLLLISPADLLTLARETGWKVREIIAEGCVEDGYAAVMEKVT